MTSGSEAGLPGELSWSRVHGLTLDLVTVWASDIFPAERHLCPGHSPCH